MPWSRTVPPGWALTSAPRGKRLGWLLPDVATALRIRLPYLEAIEDGRWPELPGNAYALGFVRAYAKLLGLDPEEMARRFRAEAGACERQTKAELSHTRATAGRAGRCGGAARHPGGGGCLCRLVSLFRQRRGAGGADLGGPAGPIGRHGAAATVAPGRLHPAG